MKKILLVGLFIPLCVYAHQPDWIEHIFGATNINAFVGNGGLSVGISSKGEITAFKWPSPSYYDQLNYLTAIVPIDAGYHAQDLPYMGAEENMGVFAGIVQNGSVYWLRDFDTHQEYLSEDDNILLTRFYTPSGEVIQETFVHPFTDVMVFHYTGGTEGSTLIFYENFAPCFEKIYMLPIADWMNDSNNDFFAFYEDNTIYHFTLKKKDEDELRSVFLLQSFKREEVVQSLISKWKGERGIWIAIGTSPPLISYQIGHDDTTRCLYSDGWRDEPMDAYRDAEDAILSGSWYGGCQVNSAITIPFDTELTVYIAVGEMYGEVKSILEWAKRRGYEKLKQDTTDYWREWIGTASLPKREDLIPFSKRTLINIKASTDRNTGAIVASISVQPPYGEDWPRDGAYLNLALDIAGYHSMVTKHNMFYVDVQRKEGLFPFLPGSYDMCYYADGIPGGPIPFEIDETAYVIWTLWSHGKFLPEDEREDYIEAIAPAIELASSMLYKECFDEEKNLQCYANEDDNPAFTQGLKGAVTYYLAMNVSAEYWRYRGDDKKAKRFKERADKVKSGIMDNFYIEEAGLFSSGFSPVSTLIWPAELDADYNRESVINWIMSVVNDSLGGNLEGFSYISKGILAIAITQRKDYEGWLEDVIGTLILSVPTSDTMIMGEAVVMVNGDFENRVSMPHNWEAALAYLSAMALYNPEVFEPLYEEVKRPGGCSTGSGDFSFIIFLVFYASWVWMRKSS